jgi:hypothetical protein
VKPVDNSNTRDQIFSVAERSPIMRVLEVWILGTPDPWDCKSVPVKKSFHYFQVLFKTGFYRESDKSLARLTSRCILFDGENISVDASLVINIKSSNIPPIMLINRIYKHQNLLSL